MGRAVFNPALQGLQADLESALDAFRYQFNADRCTKEELQGFHRHYKSLVAFEEEGIEVLWRSGEFEQPTIDRMRLVLEYTKRRESFLWLEVLSFSDDSFARSIQPSQQQGELCLF